ncbi:MAG TPA: hypothetical protein VGP79_13265 [Bryobacteraceae bacterium]|nr:hypothetical protein [Bryobacteraceae bacterium]
MVLICVYLRPSAAETLDRIAVTVGTQVITESEVLREIRVAAFLDHKTPDFRPESKRKAADRLVDQNLILQEAAVSHLPLPSGEVVQSLLDHTKEEYGADYGPALKRCFLTEQDLVDQLLQGLRTIRFTEMRFRPEVLLSNDELTDYYNNTLLAKWKQENRSPIPSFEDSRATVERLLTDERMMQSLDRWLGASRTERRILYREDVFR